VEEILQHLPQAAQVFIHYRTACVGCSLARFCALEDVANIYKIGLPTLLGVLRQEHPNTSMRPKE
jgi:Fe-S cluster biogenesis protein NfuA